MFPVPSLAEIVVLVCLWMWFPQTYRVFCVDYPTIFGDMLFVTSYDPPKPVSQTDS